MTNDTNQEVRTVRRGHVLEITLDRPKVNAIDLKASHALDERLAVAPTSAVGRSEETCR